MKKKILIGLALCIVISVGLYFCLSRPMVSVVLPTYNRAERVADTIRSVLNQTYKDFELIIINDGSKDTTADVLDYYAKKDSRIRVLTNTPNQGLIGSLNKGLHAARGKYIARLDDDDRMLPTRLEKQVAYMEKNPRTAVLATGIRTFKRGVKQTDLGCPSPSAQVLINMHFANGIAHPSTMLRRSFLNTHKLRYNPDYTSAEDYKLWQDVLLNGGELSCLPEQLTEYEIGGGHSSDFHKNQTENSRKIRLIFLNRLIPTATADLLNEPQCLILEKIITANKTRALLDPVLLEDKWQYDCSNFKGTYYLIHPNWSDYLTLHDDNKISRFTNPTHTGILMSNQDNILTIKWDSSSTERFLCTPDKKCHLIKN